MTGFPMHSTRLRPHPLSVAILCASTGLLSVAPAQAAQNGPSRLETIAVEGAVAGPAGTPASPKFTAPLRDTPQTVQVIPESVIREQGAQSLTDVLGNTPGISFNAGENGFATSSNNFQLRGFDTSGSIFVDGVRDSGSYARDVFNLEQVEVAKGPAADNGRGGAGGYVNLVTKTPKLQDFNHLTFSYGLDEYDSDNRQRTALDVNRVLNPGTALRLNLLAQDGGVPGRAVAEKNSLGVAPSLALGLDGPTRLILALQYLEQDDVPDWGVPASFVHGMKGNMPYGSTRRSDQDRFFGLASDYDEVLSHAASIRVEHDFSANMTLSNQLRWSETTQDARYTLVFGAASPTLLDTQTQFYDRRNETWSNLTNLSSRFQAGGFEHQLSTGIELSRETSDAGRYGTISSQVGIGGDPYRPVTGLNARPTQKNHVTVDTVAAYLYDTMVLSDHWQVTGGLRVERYEAEIESRDAATGAPLGSLDGIEVSDTTVGGKLGVVFKPVEQGSFYASVGLSTLPPGSWLSNPDISRTGDNAFPGHLGAATEDLRTQRAINYEIGTKWDFYDRRLSTTAALFRTERRNVAISGRDVTAGETDTTLKGYGKHIVQGLELSAVGRLDEHWSILAGAAFIDSERQHSAELDRLRCEANPGDYRAGGSAADCATGVRTDGDELAFTPKVTANLWTTYAWQNGWTVGLGGRYVSSAYLGRPDDATRIIPNGRFGKLPSYTVFNAMASWRVSDNMTLRLNIDNLTDELYATSANWPGQRVELGVARSYLLSADIRF